MARAAGQGIEVLAITDHDTTDGLPEALQRARTSHIRVVPGVEISTLSDREEIHLLGYLVDLENPALQGLLARTRQARWERAQKMLARLAELGFPLQWERLLELSGGGGSLGRPHVAMSLLDAGHVTSWDEAFERWIGRDCPAYVERYKLSPEAAIGLIHHAGGLAVLAHPYVYDRD
ncbi:MAG: PHP domain-containing protein, partial [Anaerolineae bacterium]|nr:PHP domain-containing protein [Anaerolineae bacterium]